ncbi:hypothetical protein ACOSQ3_004758 [Xanthoceras sorbifolium]
MSSARDQECHEADTGGSPDAGDRKSHPFDEVVVEYELFVSRLKAIERGGKAAATHRNEARGSSTSGRVEARRDQGEPVKVSILGDQDENEGVVPGAKKMDDPFLAVPGELQTLVDDSSFRSSVIKREDLVGGLMHTLHLPIGHMVLIPRALDRLDYPPPSYVAISSHHLIDEISSPSIPHTCPKSVQVCSEPD